MPLTKEMRCRMEVFELAEQRFVMNEYEIYSYLNYIISVIILKINVVLHIMYIYIYFKNVILL